MALRTHTKSQTSFSATHPPYVKCVTTYSVARIAIKSLHHTESSCTIGAEPAAAVVPIAAKPEFIATNRTRQYFRQYPYFPAYFRVRTFSWGPPCFVVLQHSSPPTGQQLWTQSLPS